MNYEARIRRTEEMEIELNGYKLPDGLPFECIECRLNGERVFTVISRDHPLYGWLKKCQEKNVKG